MQQSASITSSSSFIKHMIGKRSPRLLAKRLGLAWSTVYRWLNGTASPSWHDLERLSMLCDMDLEKEMRILGLGLPLEILKRARAHSTVAELAQQYGWSRVKLSKILNGQRALRLEDGLTVLIKHNLIGCPFFAGSPLLTRENAKENDMM